MNDNQPEVSNSDTAAAAPVAPGDGNETVGYADAMAELEQILRDLEGDDLDVDMLASRVERASELIGLCRERIAAARVQVERVVANLDSEDQGSAGAGAEDDEGS
ncbi:MAG: exodeoxyribonuclease VII small subunit [Acidimicrobiaceae bacterium]|nr:exodeoxyribonuclease VII small subunit [Acidimicrobiaceae bacterium]MDE0606331.1 exodeoxyribonuclease VII small subunit [Acidimicrobiaceae bacterium]